MISKLQCARRAFVRLVVRDKHDLVIVSGLSGGLTRSTAGPTISGKIRCLQVSRENRFRSATDGDVVYAVRTAPALQGIGYSPLRDGLLVAGEFTRAKTARVSVRCGEIDLWVGVCFDAESHPAAQEPSLHVVQQHIVQVSKVLDDERNLVAVIDELRECSEFLMALLSCLAHAQVGSISARLGYPGPDGSRHVCQTVHPSNCRVVSRPLHTSCDLILFRVLQAAVCAWPPRSSVVDAVHAVAGTFGESLETSFLARHAALEALAYDWLNHSGGLATLRLCVDAQDQRTPRRQDGRLATWDRRWDNGFTPALSISIWCMMDDLGVEWSDRLSAPSAGPPDFVNLRNEILHGSHVRNVIRIDEAAHLSGVLVLRTISQLLDLPDVPERGCRYWFSKAGQVGADLVPVPVGFLDPIGVER